MREARGNKEVASMRHIRLILVVAGYPRPMASLVALWDQILHPQLERFGRGVAEDGRCRRIPEHYTLGLSIGDDDPVPDLLQEPAET